MADNNEHVFQAKGAASTERFAERIGVRLRGGELIELVGDMGAGKTTFVRGLARGIDSTDIVSSPTFTIKNTYAGRLTLYHYDLYRLHQDELIRNELAETLDSANAVSVLEWAEEARAVLPAAHIKIEFQPTSETSRTLKITIPAKYNYLELA